MERWNPSYTGECISEIRGITLPADYMHFMHAHNGGAMTRLDGDDEFVMTLFPLEQVISGACCRENGFWIGSERSISQEYQNMSTQTITTLGGVHPADAPALYKAFFDHHVVIGCQSWHSGRYVCHDVIAVDRNGKYRVLEDGEAENLPVHAFGERISTVNGSYIKYSKCVYETPVGLIEPVGDGYRMVDLNTLDAMKKQFDTYRAPQKRCGICWPYTGSSAAEEAWEGDSMLDVLDFFRSGDM